MVRKFKKLEILFDSALYPSRNRRTFSSTQNVSLDFVIIILTFVLWNITDENYKNIAIYNDTFWVYSNSYINFINVKIVSFLRIWLRNYCWTNRVDFFFLTSQEFFKEESRQPQQINIWTSSFLQYFNLVISYHIVPRWSFLKAVKKKLNFAFLAIMLKNCELLVKISKKRKSRLYHNGPSKRFVASITVFVLIMSIILVIGSVI